MKGHDARAYATPEPPSGSLAAKVEALLRASSYYYRELDTNDLRQRCGTNRDGFPTKGAIHGAIRQLGDRVSRRVEREFGVQRTLYMHSDANTRRKA